MKNGFTLIELLGVIVILAIISLLVFPSVSHIIDEGTDTVYQSQINTILKGAYNYSLKNINNLPNEGNTTFVTLGELKYYGLVDINLTDPNTNEKFKDNLVISINNVGTNYKYDKKVAKLEGNYLYKIELDNLDNNSLLPQISLNGINRNTNNDYILILNLNQDLDSIGYSAVSNDGVDLTDRVKYYITSSNKLVDSIDTTKSGIYKVNYTVVDDNGYANTIILNLIIADETKPTITLPDNNKISKDISSFDLLNGVTCTDNSGFCDITTTGDINFGTPGKYIIDYTGQDPSGNTTTVKRVITIE